MDSIVKKDGRTVIVVDPEPPKKPKKDIGVALFGIAMLLFCFVFMMTLQVDLGSVARQSSAPSSSVQEIDTGGSGPFSSKGFLFPHSSEAYLTRDELMELQYYSGYDFGQLLRFACNEIFARNGFAFASGSVYESFYSQYQWYWDIARRDLEIDDLNEIEQYNVYLILEVEQEVGY